jgi:hypothetical protein
MTLKRAAVNQVADQVADQVVEPTEIPEAHRVVARGVVTAVAVMPERVKSTIERQK